MDALLDKACENNDVQLAQFIEQKGGSFSNPLSVFKEGGSALYWAAKLNSARLVSELIAVLPKEQWDSDQGFRGVSPFVYAASLGHIEAAEAFLKAGAYPHRISLKTGLSACGEAILRGNLKGLLACVDRKWSWVGEFDHPDLVVSKVKEASVSLKLTVPEQKEAFGRSEMFLELLKAFKIKEEVEAWGQQRASESGAWSESSHVGGKLFREAEAGERVPANFTKLKDKTTKADQAGVLGKLKDGGANTDSKTGEREKSVLEQPSRKGFKR